MIADLRYLEFRLKGGDPEALFQQAAARQTDALKAQTDKVIRVLEEKQLMIETQIQPHVDRLAAFHLTQKGEEALKITEARIEQIRSEQTHLIRALKTATKESQTYKQEIAKLREKLQDLQNSLYKVRSPYEKAITEFGVKLSQYISRQHDD